MGFKLASLIDRHGFKWNGRSQTYHTITGISAVAGNFGTIQQCRQARLQEPAIYKYSEVNAGTPAGKSSIMFS